MLRDSEILVECNSPREDPMLRKMILGAVLLATPLTAALAAGDTGCGAGTILWDGQSGVTAEVLAVTTNGTFGNQTFGISSGTLGCSQGGVVRVSERASMFASSNMEQLAADMAAGGGESLAALADIYAIAPADRPAFYAAAQAHFGTIFSSSEVTAGQMLASLQRVMAANDQLAKYA